MLSFSQHFLVDSEPSSERQVLYSRINIDNKLDL